MLGFLTLFGIICWAWVQGDLLGINRHLPHFPAWQEHLSKFFLWLGGGLALGSATPIYYPWAARWRHSFVY